MSNSNTHASIRFVPARLSWRRDLIVLATTLAAVLLWDASGLDLAVMRLFGHAHGFGLREAWWTKYVLHEGGRWVAYALMLSIVLSLVPTTSSFMPLGRLPRSARWWTFLTVFVCLATIPVMKKLSLTSCPWSLTAFGGVAEYVSHWRWGVRDGDTGRCFPSGHASSAFGFLAIAFAMRMADQSNQGSSWSTRWLIGLTLFGLIIGAGQTLRGAHYPSHTFWTAWICLAITTASYWLWRRWRPSTADR